MAVDPEAASRCARASGVSIVAASYQGLPWYDGYPFAYFFEPLIIPVSPRDHACHGAKLGICSYVLKSDQQLILERPEEMMTMTASPG
jgi:hypothetical protein